MFLNTLAIDSNISRLRVCLKILFLCHVVACFPYGMQRSAMKHLLEIFQTPPDATVAQLSTDVNRHFQKFKYAVSSQHLIVRRLQVGGL